uniref:AAA family ATPase n=1 Tax=Thermosipho affectus TaxID=660294 RepID=UPI0018EA0345
MTLDPRYASICGITQKELEEGFKELLEGVDKEEMKKWYNGYNFLGEKVYNPFDVL